MVPDHQTRHLAALEHLDALRREAALQRLTVPLKTLPPKLSKLTENRRWRMTFTLTVELRGAR
ncbi:hypothetical protein [Deinococcus sp.]|uniref:hypothetical protein n=1 Tax=Deinococcus sp. TaxID=47478 RepID=UPI003B5C67C9